MFEFSQVKRISLLGKVGVGVAGLGAIALVAADLAAWIVDPRAELIAGPFHLLLAIALATLMVASLIVPATVRIIWGQQQILTAVQAARPPDPDPEPDRAMEPDQVPGLTPDMVETARLLSGRLRNVA